VRADLEDIVARLGALPGLRDLAITSNGIVLGKKLPGATAGAWPPQHGTRSHS
jgi:molybdenum cofactor biosynthesis enzyme MoaA